MKLASYLLDGRPSYGAGGTRRPHVSNDRAPNVNGERRRTTSADANHP